METRPDRPSGRVYGLLRIAIYYFPSNRRKRAELNRLLDEAERELESDLELAGLFGITEVLSDFYHPEGINRRSGDTESCPARRDEVLTSG